MCWRLGRGAHLGGLRSWEMGSWSGSRAWHGEEQRWEERRRRAPNLPRAFSKGVAVHFPQPGRCFLYKEKSLFTSERMRKENQNLSCPSHWDWLGEAPLGLFICSSEMLLVSMGTLPEEPSLIILYLRTSSEVLRAL